MLTCFENIIGLSRTDNACFTGQFQETAALSTSGLFMDEIPETINILKQAKGEDGRTLHAVFDGARTMAVTSFMEKLHQELGTRYTPKIAPFNGIIGQNSGTAALNLSSNFMGSTIEMRPVSGGSMTVKRIFLLLNQTGTFTVTVYKAYVSGGFYVRQGDAIATIEANAVAMRATETVLTEPLNLPFQDDTSNIIHYLFIIDRSESGVQPLNNKATCGCSVQEAVIEHWILQGGIVSNDLDAFQTANRRIGSQAMINGITVDAEIGCTDTKFICTSYNENLHLRTAINYAILYEAASNLIQGILRGSAVNRFALMNREQMSTDVAILHNKFKSRMEWIGDNISLGNNTCYKCNSNSQAVMYKTNIRH